MLYACIANRSAVLSIAHIGRCRAWWLSAADEDEPMTIMRRLAVIEQGDGFMSWCPEVDIASPSDTIDDAGAYLREPLDLFFETAEVRREFGLE